MAIATASKSGERGGPTNAARSLARRHLPAIDQLPAEFIRVAVLLIAAEMLKTGVTSVVDHFRQTPARLDAVGAAVGAYRECGMNASIAIMLRTG